MTDRERTFILIPREIAKELSWDDDFWDYTTMDVSTIDETRWHLLTRVVFRDNSSGKFYDFVCRKGKTEYQEDEELPPMVKCREVFRTRKVVTVYE